MRWRAVCVLLMTLTACTPDSGGATRPPKATGPPERRVTSDCDTVEKLVGRVRRGWYPQRSPELSFVPRRPHYVGTAATPPHTGPWDFLGDVPLVLYGPGFIEQRGEVDKPARMVDLAPTTAELIGFREWPDRRGRVLREVLTPTASPPKLVVTLVWDGAGVNALEAHPQSVDYLKKLVTAGASFSNMSLGSTPTSTPPIHAVIGTGVYPSEHGVVAVRQRDGGGDLVDPWFAEDPTNLEVPTLADLYDEARDNEPTIGLLATVNWHLGMIGQGSSYPGGDRDLAVLLDFSGSIFGNSAFFEVPIVDGVSLLEEHTRDLDASDGRADGHWLDHPLDDLSVRYSSPAYTAWQNDVLADLIRDNGFGSDDVPDLLYVNFKQPDDAGHKWGPDSPEVGQVLRAQDRALRELVRTLDASVGRRSWVLMVTADHGMMPYPQDSGGFPIGGKRMMDDLNARFKREADTVDLVERVVAGGVYVNRSELKANNVTLNEMAEWLSRYTIGRNLDGGDPPGYLQGRSEELLFDAIVVKGNRAVTTCEDDGS
ncbi:MAG: alkaline phosphatase family protein [Actinomycetota bacterium]|nr:alkaline phosphatase family protein [Actinomycetota bacterium]